MKKIGLLVAVLAVIALAGELDTWYEDPPCSGTWVYQAAGNPQALARAWSQYQLAVRATKDTGHLRSQPMCQWHNGLNGQSAVPNGNGRFVRLVLISARPMVGMQPIVLPSGSRVTTM